MKIDLKPFKKQRGEKAWKLFAASLFVFALVSVGALGLSPRSAEASNSLITGTTGGSYSTLVGTNLYITNDLAPGYVYVVDTNPADTGTYNTVTATITVGSKPQWLTAAGHNLYVENYTSGTVSVIDTNSADTGTYNTVISTITVGSGPLEPSLVGNDLYVPNSGGTTVSVIDTNPSDGAYNTAVSITVGTHPSAATGGGDPIPLVSGRYLYVLNYNSSNVSVIDTTTNTVIATIATGSTPSHTAALVGNYLYVANYVSSGSISVIDTNPADTGTYNTVVKTITVGSSPAFPTYVSGSDDLYVMNVGGSSVSVIDVNPADTGTYNTVIATITVGGEPNHDSDPELPPIVGGRYLYVPNYTSSSMSVIDTTTNTVVSTISVGTNPSYPTLVGTNMYVLNNGGTTTSVIDTTTRQVTATISTGAYSVYPTLIGGYLYIDNANSGTISVIDPSLYDVGAPTLSSATATGSTLTLTYSNPLLTTSTPATTDFTVNVNGVPDTVNNVSVTGSTVVLTLTAATTAANTVTVSYTPGVNLITDLNRTDQTASSLSSQAVTNDNTSTLTYTAGSNGTLTGTTSQTVISGGNGTAVTAVPNSGYYFVNWSDNSTANPRTDTNVTGNISVTANFALNPTIAPSLSAPVSSTTYAQGTLFPLTFTLPQTPESGTITATFTPTVSGTPIILTLQNVASGTTSLSLPLTALVNGSNGVATTTANSIPVGSYTVTLSYQNSLGAITANASATNVVIATPPSLTTTANPLVTAQTTATLGGTISSTGGVNPTSRGINYGLTTSYGSTSPSDTGSFSTGTYSEAITGLACNTLYHYQAFATNGAGTGTGSDATFTTALCSESGGSNLIAPLISTVPLISTGGATTVTGCTGSNPFSSTTGQRCSTTTTTSLGGSVSTFIFTMNLRQGMTGPDVQELQKFLDTHGFPVATTGWGSVNQPSIFFGAKTTAALKLYQASVNLPATGYFGVMTRGVVNQVIG